MARKWIQKAIKHPGALHKQLGVPQGSPIPAKKLAAAARKGGILGRRARLAQTLKGLHHKGAVAGKHYSKMSHKERADHLYGRIAQHPI